VVGRVPARLGRLRRALVERVPRLHRFPRGGTGVALPGLLSGGRLHPGRPDVEDLGATVPLVERACVDRLDVRHPRVEHLVVEPPIVEPPAVGPTTRLRPTARFGPTARLQPTARFGPAIRLGPALDLGPAVRRVVAGRATAYGPPCAGPEPLAPTL